MKDIIVLNIQLVPLFEVPIVITFCDCGTEYQWCCNSVTINVDRSESTDLNNYWANKIPMTWQTQQALLGHLANGRVAQQHPRYLDDVVIDNPYKEQECSCVYYKSHTSLTIHLKTLSTIIKHCNTSTVLHS